MLGATMLFAFGKHLTGRISASIAHDATNAAVTGASLFELFVAVYGGYFGGGLGLLNLATLAALGMTDLHAMNKLKVILGGGIHRLPPDPFLLPPPLLPPAPLLGAVC